MKVANEKVIIAASMSADFESQPLLIEQCYGFGFQCIFTGSPNGAMKLQASNDDVQLEDQVVNWSDVANSSSPITSSGDLLYFDEGFDEDERRVINENVRLDFELTVVGITHSAIAFKLGQRLRNETRS